MPPSVVHCTQVHDVFKHVSVVSTSVPSSLPIVWKLKKSPRAVQRWKKLEILPPVSQAFLLDRVEHVDPDQEHSAPGQLRYESSTLILCKELSSTIFQSLSVSQ